MDLLDAFGDHGEVLDRYRAQYAQLAERRAEAEALQGDGPDLATQKDLLAWQIREIEEAELEGTDEAQIQEEHAVAAHARRIAELIQGALEALTEGDHSAFAGLSFTQKALDEMSRLTRQAHEWLDEARSVAIRIQELADTLNRYGQNVDCDPQRLEWLESRMAALHRLKRKYGSSVHDILSSLERARKQLYDLEHREERMAELAEWIRNAEADLRETGARLSALRRKSARALSAAVSDSRTAGSACRSRRRKPSRAVWTMWNSVSLPMWGKPCGLCAKSRRAAKYRASCWPSKSFCPITTASPFWSSTRLTPMWAGKWARPLAKNLRGSPANDRPSALRICRKWRPTGPRTG